MMTRESERRFFTIGEAVERTGLSSYFLRRGCRDGSVPCIRAGVKYLINLPALVERLDQLSRANTEAIDDHH